MIGSLAEDGSDKGLVVDVTVATITKQKHKHKFGS